MTTIRGIDIRNYLGLPVSDIFLEMGMVSGGDRERQFVKSQFEGEKVLPEDLRDATTIEDIYNNICVRIGQPLNALVAADMEP